MFQFRDKVAVVTGGASGIGLALAQEALARGMRVCLSDRDANALEQVHEETLGGSELVCTRSCDVRELEQQQALAAFAAERFGKVHVLFSNAGVGGPSGPIWKLDPQYTRWTYEVNLLGPIWGVQAFVPHMLQHGEDSLRRPHGFLLGNGVRSADGSLRFVEARCRRPFRVLSIGACRCRR